MRVSVKPLGLISASELCLAAGVNKARLRELEGYGVIKPTVTRPPRKYYRTYAAVRARRFRFGVCRVCGVRPVRGKRRRTCLACA